MERLAIIADDLTSATDCGIQVARSGMDTLVIFGDYRAASAIQTATAISVDTDTRGASPCDAYNIVRDISARINAHGFRNVYKSFDSTLRGNLGPEIDAVMDIYDFELCMIVPAFPHYGRTTVNGKHFLDGVPLTRTEFADDPRNPVREDDLIKLFSSQSRRKAGLVALDVLRSEEVTLHREIHMLKSKGVELIVFDAELEQDLERIVGAVSKMQHRMLWAGSTGLARCVPRILKAHDAAIDQERLQYTKGRIMLVSGSTSETTRMQLDILRERSQMTMVEMRPPELVSSEERAEIELGRCHSLLVRALLNGNDVALHVPPSRKEVDKVKMKGKEVGINESQVSIKVSGALAEIASQIAKEFEIRGLIITGGETAKRVCSQIGCIGIRLIDEVEPGIPLGSLVGSTEILIVTKAGAFGSLRVLDKAMKILKAGS
jgi:uncharacterized protein YgbK (DUF1537 family)